MRTPPLSLALVGLAPVGPAGAGVREQIAWARSAGFEAVQLNAAASGVRPRDLDRSGRRDLAALLRRDGLALSGMDLWIPPEHFTTPANADRAIASVLSAVELAAELRTLVAGNASTPGLVSVVFPSDMPADASTAIADRADRAGVHVADHAFPPASPAPAAAIAVGIDPAAVLAGGGDPVALASALGERLAAARLSDIARTLGGGRVAPGSRDGRLDVLAYVVALTTSDFGGCLVLDARGLADPAGALELARAAMPDPAAGRA